MNVTYLYTGLGIQGSLDSVREKQRSELESMGYKIVGDHPPNVPELDLSNIRFGEFIKPVEVNDVILDEDYVQKCGTKPSYNAAKCNGVIAMNPYSRGRVFFRTKTTTISKEVGRVLVQGASPGIVLTTYNQGGYFIVRRPNGSTFPDRYVYMVEAKITGSFPFFEKVSLIGPQSKDRPLIETSNLETGVFTSLMASVARSDFDIATNIGESKATVDGFLTLLPKLFDDISKLRKLATKLPKDLMGRRIAKWQIRKALLEAPEVVADYRLLWRYGVQPVYHASLDLEKALRPRSHPLFQTVRDGDSLNLEVPGWRGTVKLKAHGVWKGRFTLTDSQTKRFSLYVPTMMYELVPYSFVADWFVNLGELIAAVRPMPTQYSNSCLSTKCEADLKWFSEWAVTSRSGVVSQYFDFGPRWGLQSISGELTILADTIELETGRYIAQTFHRGQGRLGLSTNTDLSLNQSLDALALLWKQLASRRRHSFWSV